MHLSTLDVKVILSRAPVPNSKFCDQEHIRQLPLSLTVLCVKMVSADIAKVISLSYMLIAACRSVNPTPRWSMLRAVPSYGADRRFLAWGGRRGQGVSG